jgi:preprotein translocase subunit SecD
MAILLIEKGKGEVVTAPVIRTEIGGGRVQISGRMSTMEANDTALLLRAGSLAAPMDIIEERTIGPASAPRTSEGLPLDDVGLHRHRRVHDRYYHAVRRRLGAGAGLQPAVPGRLLSLLQATLTLPGIAAIALTLGMAIDANVLINERIREELRAACRRRRPFRPATSAPSAPFSTPTSPR